MTAPKGCPPCKKTPKIWGEGCFPVYGGVPIRLMISAGGDPFSGASSRREVPKEGGLAKKPPVRDLAIEQPAETIALLFHLGIHPGSEVSWGGSRGLISFCSLSEGLSLHTVAYAMWLHPCLAQTCRVMSFSSCGVRSVFGRMPFLLAPPSDLGAWATLRLSLLSGRPSRLGLSRQPLALVIGLPDRLVLWRSLWPKRGLDSRAVNISDTSETRGYLQAIVTWVSALFGYVRAILTKVSRGATYL